MSAPCVVFDSNVVVSAFIYGGKPAQAIALVTEKKLECATSPAILDELLDVLRRPRFGLSASESLAIVDEFRELCRVVFPVSEVHAVANDPDDDAILECALAAEAEVVVSGDAHLLRLGQWQGIRILSPAELLQEQASR